MERPAGNFELAGYTGLLVKDADASAIRHISYAGTSAGNTTGIKSVTLSVAWFPYARLLFQQSSDAQS